MNSMFQSIFCNSNNNPKILEVNNQSDLGVVVIVGIHRILHNLFDFYLYSTTEQSYTAMESYPQSLNMITGHKYHLNDDAWCQYHDKSETMVITLFLCIYIRIPGISATEKSENQNINLKRMFTYSNPQAKTRSHQPPTNSPVYSYRGVKISSDI